MTQPSRWLPLARRVSRQPKTLATPLNAPQVVDPSRGSVLRSHRRAMSCQISSTQVVDPSRGSVVRSHSKVMHGPCRPPQQAKLALTPPQLFRTDEQLTAPADRPVRAPAHAVAFTTAVAIRGAGSVHRRTGMRTVRALPVDRNRPGSPPATDCRQNSPPARRPGCGLPPPPTASAPQSNCRSRLDTRPARTPVNASPPPLRATMHDSGPPWVAIPSTYDSSIHNTLPVFAGAQEVQNDTQRAVGARGVSTGEPGESHAARFRNLTQTGRPRCGRESSQGAAGRYAILSRSK